MADGGTKVGTAYVEVSPKAVGNFEALIEKQMPDGTDGGERFGGGFSGGMREKIGAGAVAVGKILADVVEKGASAAKDLIGEAFSGFSDYQQLTGGVETLMGTNGAKSVQEYATAVDKSVDEVSAEYEALSQVQQQTLDNAAQAFASAGMSANDYMETVTGFAASLKSGLGEARLGELAAESDKAVTDMADNASKMGTDIESIQNAYAGFAKQNYTMLDNLKLGYGGTKSEMERLLADAEKVSGVKYDVENFADIVDALHVVQNEMGISGYSISELNGKLKDMSLTEDEVARVADSMGVTTDEVMSRMKAGTLDYKDAQVLLGTTAKEAATTVEGSMNAMRGAWENWVAALGRDDVDMSQMTDQLIEWVGIAADNVLPVVTRAFSRLSSELPHLVETIGPVVLPAIASVVADVGSTLLTLATQTIPDVLSQVGGMALQALEGSLGQISQGVGTIVNVGGGLVSGLLDGVMTAMPVLAEAVVAAVDGLAQTLPVAMAALGPQAIQAFSTMVATVGAVLPQLIATLLPLAVQGLASLVGSVATMLPSLAGTLISAASAFLATAATSIAAQLPALLQTVAQALPALATTIASGLVAAVPQLTGALVQMLGSGVGAAASVFPSLMASLISAAVQAVSSLAATITAQIPTLVSALMQAVATLVQMLPALVDVLLEGFNTALPTVAAAALSLLGAIVDALPTVIDTLVAALPTIINSVVTFLTGALPQVLQSAVTMLGGIVQALPTVLGALIGALPAVLSTVVGSLISAIPSVMSGALSMFMSIVQGLASAAPSIIGGLLGFLATLPVELIAAIPQMIGAAADLFNAIGQGLSDVVPRIGEALEYFVTHLPEILWNGITGMADAAGAMFGGIVDGILGNTPEAEQAASDLAVSASNAALESADGSDAGQKWSDSFAAAFDFGSVEQKTAQGVADATDNAAAGIDASAISEAIMQSATGSLDTSEMDPPATEMAQNAVDAALGVDATQVGEQFSLSAASGIDVNALSDKAREMAGVTGSLDQSATVSVKADLSGVNQLKGGADAVKAAFAAMQGAATSSMAAVSKAASSAAPAYSQLANSIASSMRSASSAATTAAASIRTSLSSVSGKTVYVNVAAGDVKLPHFSMTGDFDPKTKKVPTVSVSWYAKGGIFPANTPQVIGVGDARVPEVVAPIDRLRGMLLDDAPRQGGDVNVALNYDAGADANRMALDLARSVRRIQMARGLA